MSRPMDESLVGHHVMMDYRGRRLLGTVRLFNVPRNPKSYPFLTVYHFNGEPWPLEPLTYEVHVLCCAFEEGASP